MENKKELTSHEKKQMKKQKKHEEMEKQRDSALSSNTKKSFFKYIVYAILIIAAGWGLFALANRAPTYADTTYENELLNVNLQEHANLALHIHPTLEIEILGDRKPIPANIGISAAGMKVVHTHDTTGTIHIETPYPAQLHLREFFTIWNKTFNSTCIFEYCTNETHELKMYVNGEESAEFENLPFQDLDAIKIIYSEKQ